MSSINVSLINAASAKAQTMALPRDMTVADLQKLSPKYVAFTVAGCTPAPATKLGDLYDACAKNGSLEVSFTQQMRMGGGCCLGPCSATYEGVNQDALGTAMNNTANDIREGMTNAINDTTNEIANNAGLGNLF